jgi:hypothetical protein
MTHKFELGHSKGQHPDNCGGICELTYSVGVFYIFLICLGFLFVTLKQQESLNVFQARPADSALFQALLPFDSGR